MCLTHVDLRECLRLVHPKAEKKVPQDTDTTLKSQNIVKKSPHLCLCLIYEDNIYASSGFHSCKICGIP